MYYATLVEAETKYRLDDNGNKIIVDTIDGIDYYEEEGTTEEHYSDVKKFHGTIKLGGGNSTDTEFGLDLSQYSAVLVLAVKSFPITETSLIWVDSEPTQLPNGNTDPSSADYYVVKRSVGINTIRYALQKVVK